MNNLEFGRPATPLPVVSNCLVAVALFGFGCSVDASHPATTETLDASPLDEGGVGPDVGQAGAVADDGSSVPPDAGYSLPADQNGALFFAGARVFIMPFSRPTCRTMGSVFVVALEGDTLERRCGLPGSARAAHERQ
jgi:hypothetical protein